MPTATPAPVDPSGSVPDLPDQAAYDTLSRDGVTLHLRPVAAADRAALGRLVQALSPRSAYQRFFTASRPAAVDYVEELFDPARTTDTVVATWRGELVGVGSTHRLTPTSVEVALLVDDAHQGRGLGTLMLEDLVAHSRSRGVRSMAAWLLRTNAQMLEVFTHLGLPLHTEVEGGDTLAVTLSLRGTAELERAVAERQRAAVVRSLTPLLRPQSVVVVGAGARRDGVGHQVLTHLRRGEFRGQLYAVNRRGHPVAGVVAQRRVTDLPGPVDLAVVAVPAESVLQVARDCVARGVGAMAVLSAGFGESNGGAAAEAELRQICRDGGVRLLGPNCMGLVNTERALRLDASFLPTVPARGPVAVIAQSGAVAASIVAMLAARGLGVSTLVTIGNSPDVGPADLLAWAAEDRRTKVAVVHVESLEDPEQVVRSTAAMVGSMPVVLLKSGRTPVAASAAHSHTGAAAADDAAVDALCRRAGLLRVDSLTELVDTAAVLALQRPPRGGRTVVVGNSGGTGVLALDACAEAGLLGPELTQHTVMRLRSLLPRSAAIGPLVDTTAAANLAQLTAAVSTLADDPGVDAVVAVVIALEQLPAAIVRDMLDQVARDHPRTAFVASGVELAADPGAMVPAVADPRHAVRALANVVEWSARTSERAVARSAAAATTAPAPESEPAPAPGMEGGGPVVPHERDEAARAVVQEVLRASPAGAWLTPGQVRTLLRDHDVELVPVIEADDPGTAAEAAAMLPFPVVLKGLGPTLLHKSVHGAVVLGLRSADEVRAAARDMLTRLDDAVTEFVVQPQVHGRPELIVGGVRLPHWGALVMVGRGGVDTEVDPDRAWGLAPVPEPEASVMLRSLRCAGAVRGPHGQSAADPHALTRLVHQVSELMDQVPEVVELDLNPVIVGDQHPLVVDARVRVAPAPDLPWRAGLRRLRE